MEIVLLGTGTPIPDAHRAGPATLVRSGADVVLVDAGRGVLMRLAALGLFPVGLSAVAFTHLHSDHLTDLNDVITTHWVMSPTPTTLPIYGPPGIREVVDGILASLAPDIRYRIAHHDDLTWGPQVEVTELVPGSELAIGGLQVLVGATDHRPVEPTVAYRFSDGSVSAVLAGDGVPCDALDDLCRGADAYVQTVLRDDIVRLVPNARFQDILDYHSSVEQAALTASRAGVGTLVLTHYIPGMPSGQEATWRALAAAHFAGPIVLGDDLTSVTVTPGGAS